MAHTENEIMIDADGVCLQARIGIPDGADNLIIFVHGTGSSRNSPRNGYVAETLRDAGCATLLFDLLTEEEDRRYANRFDIDLITRRIIAATEWIDCLYRDMILSYFGASTGSAAALKASVTGKSRIASIVSRGGRPDMVQEILPRVTAPTLFIVGGADTQVLDLNRTAYGLLTCRKSLKVVPGATHLFEEEGALEEVAQLAAGWFLEHDA